MPKTQIVLPARLASTRLPEKLLQKVAGKSVLQHTWEAAGRARCAADGVIVAVDHPRMAEEVQSFGGRWTMTPADCPSGTDRIAAVADAFPTTEIFVNVQSDEPEIDPEAIDAVADLLIAHPEAQMATAGTPIRDSETLANPNVVKIVLAPDAGSAGQGRAVYFSRAPVPFDRDGQLAERLAAEPPVYWHHLGLYAYRRDFLKWFAASPPSTLEQIERLEQLRAIEAGKPIVVTRVARAQSGIDTAEDLRAFRLRQEQVA
ncbi:3-deoxy-manno-octulosonate cytidylyltransferase [Roseiconus nitratireducens]|uniref:3-deoxy-manno-octulosonate cytidylyltransferase n=1 Tax=Roseiconus nitratireducens TaxID=2605748 RepID=A0A5M6DA23_9BACT|nr:3-deoxy-manno-octulosonate cytidylyltransferase [Roseiconus nitratireducens]KAA5544391.1 3-deoxy-manno-octulosonate cytidylyltransferase [Roseiconus nitratireducens]